MACARPGPSARGLAGGLSDRLAQEAPGAVEQHHYELTWSRGEDLGSPVRLRWCCEVCHCHPRHRRTGDKVESWEPGALDAERVAGRLAFGQRFGLLL